MKYFPDLTCVELWQQFEIGAKLYLMLLLTSPVLAKFNWSFMSHKSFAQGLFSLEGELVQIV